MFLQERTKGTIFQGVFQTQSQANPRRFGLGLVSIGAFLRASDSLVVFWDPSWSRRLWCVFELAAFMHSRKADGRKVKLTIRPTLLLGSCSIAVGLAI